MWDLYIFSHKNPTGGTLEPIRARFARLDHSDRRLQLFFNLKLPFFTFIFKLQLSQGYFSPPSWLRLPCKL